MLCWPVSNSGVKGFSVQGLQRPPYTLPRHRLLTCASTCAFTTTERALANQTRRLFTIIDSMLLPVVCHVSCGLRQRHYRIIRCTCAGFTKATYPLLPTKESTVFEQTLRARTTINHNALIGRCPLLIAPGQCAEFVYKESEDLADLQAITPPSEQHHRLHLSLWSVSKKSAKSLTKTI